MSELEYTNPPIVLRSLETRPGYVTLVVLDNPPRAEFIPEGVIAEVLDGGMVGRRDAVKVKLIHGGKEYVGWVHRRWFRDQILYEKQMEIRAKRQASLAARMPPSIEEVIP